MTSEDADPIDELVREARPGAPPRLAPAVIARVAARRNLRRAAIAASAVLAAAALLLVWVQREPKPVAPPAPATHERAAGPPAPAPPTPPAPPAAAPPDWSDMPALLAEVEAAQRAAIARCVPASRAPQMATFRIERGPDGKVQTMLVIHHSLGYLGYSDEERCLQKVAAALALPPLPDGLTSVAFTLAPPSAAATTTTWRDPVRTGQELLAPARSRLDTCVLAARVPRPQQALAVFEPAGGPYRAHRAATARARVVLDEHSPWSMQQCVSHAARDIAVPALPEHVDQVILALPLVR